MSSGRTAGIGVALTEFLAVQPLLEVLLGLPTGVDEVAGLALDRTEELEVLEALELLDHLGPAGEPPLELWPHALGDADGIDLDDAHPPMMPGPRRPAQSSRPVSRARSPANA